MVCNRGIYHKGWTAVTRHGNPALGGRRRAAAARDDVWELYDTTQDWSQARRPRPAEPQKARRAAALFDSGGRKYNVFPLDDRKRERANSDIAGRPSVVRGTRSCCFPACAAVRERRHQHQEQVALGDRRRWRSLAGGAQA
jgi:arylsulfatase